MEEFLQPANEELYADDLYTKAQLGSSVMHDLRYALSEGAFDVALLGVQDDRGSVANNGCAMAPDVIRRHFFSLALPVQPVRIIDLGNIIQGETTQDTFTALLEVTRDLLQKKIIPIIIGGSHDLTLAQYKAYENHPGLNLTIIDHTIDFREEDAPADDENFIQKILQDENPALFNLSCIAYQTHLTPSSVLELFEKLHFDNFRLGKLRAEISNAEPLLRGTQALSFDLSAIRYSDAPGNRLAKPTGLFSEEACQLARYAGESARVNSFGLYGCNPSVDKDEQTAQLAAHIIWYFIDGFYHRKNEWPRPDDSNFVKYTIHFRQTKYELHFWKSLSTDRWWMAVPAISKSGANASTVFIPCTYLDYQMACKEELPERWIKAHEKLS